MPEPQHPQYEDIDIINVETHHEKSDVNVRALLWSVAIFIVFGFLSHLLLWGMYRMFVSVERGNVQPPLTEMARPSDMNVPSNQPLLQPFPRPQAPPYSTTPVIDLAEMRANEQRALTTYGWVDQQKGIVRIPIDQAKKKALQQGFPLQGGTP